MSSKKHILVTGANGQLGMECRVLSEKHKQYRYTFLSRSELSVSDKDAVETIFNQHTFDYCINCAAYTAVDKAETEKEQAFDVNAQAVKLLAEVCDRKNVRLIHISTDYVFDGENEFGYLESDATAPLNVYGASKLVGEINALHFNPRSIIIRTSWVYSSFGKNFVKTMMHLMKEKDQINVVSDQIGSPTYAADLAGVIFKFISSSQNIAAGIYHYSNSGVISWYDFALAIKSIGGYSCKINPIPSSDYPVPAKRPHYSILNTKKIQSTLGIEIPQWQESLKQCMALLS